MQCILTPDLQPIMKSTGPFVAQPGFDAAHMYQTYGDDASTVKEILEAYLQELPNEIALMKENFEQAQYGELMGNLHKMKPGFLYVGLNELYHKVALLEACCSTGVQDTVLQQQFPQLMQAISESQEVIASAINSLNNP